MKKTALFLCLSFFFFSVFAYAEDKKEDFYKPVYEKPLKTSSLKDPVSRVLAFPFELIKWPLDKALVFMEKKRLDRKAIWLYEKSVEYGVTPRVDSLNFNGIPSYGADFDFVRIFRQKEMYPDLIAKGWINHGPAVYFQTGAEFGKQRIADTGFHVSEFFQYENRRNETFYGIGPYSSRGDSASYIIERTTLATRAGYEFSPTLDLTSQFGYDHVNIKNRSHGGKGNITEVFARDNIPGLYGDDLLSYSLSLKRDTRDSKSSATQGSYQKLIFKYTDGVQSSKAQYFTYQVDAAKYFQLASPRRVLAARLFAEHNQTINRGDVPFYNMAKLGGSGTFPYVSQTSRGYVYDRFYGQSAVLLNLEYRYTIWQHREFQLDTVFFVDEGQVFGNLGKFNFSHFRESYGMGFNLNYSKLVLLSFDVAHGDEGTQFYIENKIPF